MSSDCQSRSGPSQRSLRPLDVNLERLKLQPRVSPLQGLSCSLPVDVLRALRLVGENPDAVGEDFGRASVDCEVLRGIPLGGQGQHAGA